MANNYVSWTSNRGNSPDVLEKRPHITQKANGVRYYSSVDAELYFGNIFIDEVTSIQWSVQQQTMPIFGYNSYCFDDIAVGSRLIQGQFAVNFTKTGFLTNLAKDTEWQRIARKIYHEDIPADSYFTSDFRRRLNMPVWDGGFDIVVGFGDHGQSASSVSSTEWKTFLVLDCCQITGSMVQLDYNGEPVQEVYTFIARDVKYSKATGDEIQPVAPGTDPELSRPELKLVSVIESAGNDQLALRIKNLNNLTLQSASLSLTSSVLDKQLTTKMDITTNSSGELYMPLDINKSKLLRSAIKNNDLKTVSADAKIIYYVSELDKGKGTATVSQTIYFNVDV